MYDLNGEPLAAAIGVTTAENEMSEFWDCVSIYLISDETFFPTMEYNFENRENKMTPHGLADEKTKPQRKVNRCLSRLVSPALEERDHSKLHVSLEANFENRETYDAASSC